MYLSARARLILEQFLDYSLPVSLKKLSKDLNVSERTIRRDMKEVEDTLFSYNLQLKKENGLYQLLGSDKDIQNFRWYLMDLSYNEYSPDERQLRILKTLLKEENGVKLIGLANDLNVTVSTISGDLNKLEEQLPNGVTIERKRGAGVSLEAPEIEKRHLMSEIVGEQFPNYQLLKYFQKKEKSEMTTTWLEDRLLNLVDENILQNVEVHIREWREREVQEISDEAYVNLVVHLSIAIERIIDGNFVQSYDYEQEILDSSEYQTAQRLLADILEIESEVVPEGEAVYISMYLRSLKSRKADKVFFENEDMQVILFAKKMIGLVEEELDQELPKDQLLKGLISHLKPTFRRLEQGLRIYNPLIQSIKQDYPELFQIIRRVFDQIYQGDKVLDEEIGYLVLHFGSVLLQLESEAEFSGLVVCASGIGTSRMLVTRLRQKIPQMKKLQTVSLFELAKKRKESDIDIIISTIDLGKVDFDYFLVSPILTEQEIMQIDLYLKNAGKTYSQRKNSTGTGAAELTTYEAIQLIEERQIYHNIVLDILKNFNYVFLEKQMGTTEDILRAVCTQLLEKDSTINVELLISLLMKDENWSGFGIPNTRIGMFHGRDEMIQQPFFQLFHLSEELSVKGMDQTEMNVNKLVLLLAPEKYSQEGLKVLSYISAMFVDDPELVDILEYGTVKEVSNYFVKRLMDFLAI
ncbi:BglG family transcription antiterminator [Enterococcus sp. BWB1-3]|uniref:BglG family transcription antiterminator n=1 Tax=unclassified Enterococcus TaxID=2608891 RepID=UPI001921CF8C|nr:MULTISPECIES: BglG family transcription antiterminator [unclassified Enterococcus]MBL1230916.1 BglG family transcription antiterminator [Enterococcus sp. BWB1-3]MCB5956245.1 BglG family transcription antiterminator [Enterococcus sp. CWB-B31]